MIGLDISLLFSDINENIIFSRNCYEVTSEFSYLYKEWNISATFLIMSLNPDNSISYNNRTRNNPMLIVMVTPPIIGEAVKSLIM